MRLADVGTQTHKIKQPMDNRTNVGTEMTIKVKVNHSEQKRIQRSKENWGKSFLCVCKCNCELQMKRLKHANNEFMQ